MSLFNLSRSNFVVGMALFIAAFNSHSQESGRGISGGGACVSVEGSSNCQLLDYAEYQQGRPAYFFPMGDAEISSRVRRSIINFRQRCISNSGSSRTHETATIVHGAVHALGPQHFRDFINSQIPSNRTLYIEQGVHLNELVWIFSRITPLERLNDEGIIRYTAPVGRNRQIKQIAVQKNGVVLVDRQLYLQLNKDEKAGLVVQNAILRDLLERRPWAIMRHGTSFVRDVVGLVSDSDFSQLSQAVVNQRCGMHTRLMNDSIDDVLAFIESPQMREDYKVYHLLLSKIIGRSNWDTPASSFFNPTPAMQWNSAQCLRVNRVSGTDSPEIPQERQRLQSALKNAGFSNLCSSIGTHLF